MKNVINKLHYFDLFDSRSENLPTFFDNSTDYLASFARGVAVLAQLANGTSQELTADELSNILLLMCEGAIDYSIDEIMRKGEKEADNV